MVRPDPRTTLRRIYGRAHGYEISKDEVARVAKTGSAATYGELTPRGILAVLDWLDLGADDVFFDLGSGIGKVVMLAALHTEAASLVGVELVRSRHDIASERRERAESEELIAPERVEFRRADMLRTPLRTHHGNATCVYACSTAYPTAIVTRLARRLARLDRGARFVTLQDLDDNPWFEEREVLKVDTSWKRGTEAHCYELVRPYGFTRRRRGRVR